MDHPVFIWEECRWIGAGPSSIDWRTKRLPAPFFRREFEYDGKAESCVVSFSGLGYGELYLNGEKLGDAVLDPVPTQYESRVHFVRHDVSRLLKPGKNVFGMILGSGWYNLRTAETWHFDKASWIDFPKFLFLLACDGKSVLASDGTWKCTSDGPIVFEQLRNGEHYDARREMPGWSEPGFDDSAWNPAEIVPGPGGELELQTMPACRIQETIPAISSRGFQKRHRLFDFGRNLAGWVRIRARGDAGSSIVVRYGEHDRGFGPEVNNSSVDMFVESGEFQTDRYILRGAEVEIWEPRFVYHGFRYVEMELFGNAEVLEAEARSVCTGFERRGEFSCSQPLLERLWECTRVSYECNYIGIPTDCPHREKNGWTGDAAMAIQTGLTLADSFESYRTWLRMLGDAQRRSGQLPGICPTGGWGFNWGSGPVYDSAFWEIPWQAFLFSGDASLLKEHYQGLRRHFDFLGTLAQDDLIAFGLGDWCPPDWSAMLDCRFSSSCYYCREAQIIGKTARLLGDGKTADMYRRIAERIAANIHREYYHDGGIYVNGELTASALALAFGIVPEGERQAVIRTLVEKARAVSHTAQFGIIGAKFVPRMLAEHGYIDDALEFFLQPQAPGWANWMLRGATSLWENWDGGKSQCHIMFGDFAGWAMRYLGGIGFDEEDPGNMKLRLTPHFPVQLDRLAVEYRGIRLAWRKADGKVFCSGKLPDRRSGTLVLPDGRECAIAGDFACDCRWMTSD